MAICKQPFFRILKRSKGSLGFREQKFHGQNPLNVSIYEVLPFEVKHLPYIFVSHFLYFIQEIKEPGINFPLLVVS